MHKQCNRFQLVDYWQLRSNKCQRRDVSLAVRREDDEDTSGCAQCAANHPTDHRGANWSTNFELMRHVAITGLSVTRQPWVVCIHCEPFAFVGYCRLALSLNTIAELHTTMEHYRWQPNWRKMYRWVMHTDQYVTIGFPTFAFSCTCGQFIGCFGFNFYCPHTHDERRKM